MNRRTGVIMDMDGVIFDSERAYIEVFRAFCARDGIECDEQTCLRAIGSTREKTRRIFLETYGEDFPFERYYSECRDSLAQMGVDRKPGVGEWFDYLRESRIPVALASSTSRESVERMLTDAGLIGYFDVLVCGDMVSRSKPDPEIFLTAAQAIGIPPASCYVVEDSFNGIRAAHAAGMHPIMVPDLLQPDDCIRALAEVVLPSLFEVKEYFSKRII